MGNIPKNKASFVNTAPEARIYKNSARVSSHYCLIFLEERQDTTMNSIGEQIKKYRVARGITQEQLGNLVGVTTQAVSRWERGGTPDVEILPALSEILGVSIDTLFGLEDQSFALNLARRLSQLPREEACRYAFNICWAIQIGMMGDVDIIDDFMNKLIDNSFIGDNKTNDYFAKLVFEEGMANTRISSHLNYFFFLVGSENGNRDDLSDFESLRNVFKIFADRNLLKIIFYMYSLPNKPVVSALISKNTDIDEDNINKYMDVLCKNNLVTHTVIATAGGDLDAYTFRRESFAVPFLCFADEIAKKDLYPFYGGYFRKTPLL